jgi:hypothetical protein
MAICSHSWIDPEEPPIERAPYSPVIGPGRREMKAGRRYACANCGQSLRVPTRAELFGEGITRRERFVVTADDVGELPPLE